MTSAPQATKGPHAGTLFLVDGMSHIFRAFYAIRNLSNSQGLPTNAVYGFATMLRKLMREYRPAYLAIVFDGSQPTFRHEAFEAYKANRAQMPEDLAVQIPYIRRLCEALSVPVVEMERYEADDIIGTLAKKAEAEGLETVIVSNDKDMFQLVSDRIRVLHQAKEDTVFDSEKAEAFFGVPPSQVVDVLGLMGDSVDNVPGAPGIGEKGAKDLIRRFGSLQNLLDNADQVERKTYRESLKENRQQILQSKQLVTIDTQVPIQDEWRSLEAREADSSKLRDLFIELGFQSLLKDFQLEAPRAVGMTPVQPIRTSQDALKVVERLKKEELVYCFLALDHEEPMLATAVQLALKAQDDVWVADFKTDAVRIQDFKAFFECDTVAKVFHNEKAARILLSRAAGTELVGVRWDTMLMSYLVQPNRSNHAFDDICFALLEEKSADPERRGDLLQRVFSSLHPRIRDLGLEKVHHEIELPLSSVLADVEQAGVRVDSDRLNDMSGELDKEMSRLTKRAYQLAGEEFNINSPKQLGEILFEKLNLPAPKKLKKSGQYSTSVDVLEQLASEFELPRLMLEYRQLAKLKSGYVDALPRLVNPQTGRVHTSFNQTVAATGRLSSSNPNLQNIPIRTELGGRIRSAFIPSPGCRLLSADYSQIELRILAHLSNDPVLTDSFRRGEDVHTRTAAEVFGVAAGLQTPDLRRRAKAINFGIIYGQTAFGLAKELGISNGEAQQFIKTYFERYRGVKQFIDQSIAETRKTQMTRTLFGRLRQISDIGSRNPAMRNFAERTAVNSPIQGTAADIIKLAMIRIHHLLREKKLRATMILQVHDELVFDVPEEELNRVESMVRREMESVCELSVPLVVTTGSGPNWMET
ncbi:MAG: DNA polymerase I [Acidobacteriota bacterium]